MQEGEFNCTRSARTKGLGQKKSAVRRAEGGELKVRSGEEFTEKSAKRRARGKAYRERSTGWRVQGGQYNEEGVKRGGQGGEDTRKSQKRAKGGS